MSSGYGRPPSPPRTNRYHPPAGRTSASSFFTSSAYDPYIAPTRTSRDYVAGPRLSDERVAAPRLPPPRTRSPPRRAALDDYAVPLRTRPRRSTLEPEPPRAQRPVSMIGPSESIRAPRPVITSAIDRPQSPTTKPRRDRRDEEYEVLPASSAASTSRRHHQRHASLNTSDPGRLVSRDREPEERTYRVSNLSRPSVRERQGENDRDYGFEYTEAREPRVQDTAYRQRSRRDSFDSTRPKSMIAPDAYIPRSTREPGPPVSSRGFEQINRSDSQRHGQRTRDDDRAPREYIRDDRDIENRKLARPEITLHQPSNDGYAPPYPEEESRHHRARKPAPEDDRLEPRTRLRKPGSEEDRLEPRVRDPQDDRSGDERPRRHRHKHHHRDHDHRDHDRYKENIDEDIRERRIRDEVRDKRDRSDDGSHGNGMLAGAGAAAAATGLAAEEVRRRRHRDSRDDDGGYRPREPRYEEGSHRYKEPRDEGDTRSVRRPQEFLREPERDHLDTSSISTGPSISEREDLEYQEAREASRRAKEQAEAFVGDVEPVLREQKSYERRPEDDAPRHHRSYRPRRHHTRTYEEDSWSESSFSSSSDSEEDRRSRPPPRVVTPANEERSEPKPPPKGILRKPRDQFPEYPATMREGVAPHKDDKKKDVPPNARWTKIDRRLVNPEALEQDGIRFNEFVDHVIVLKVMDREEIEKYTQKTAEIREKRRLLTMGQGPGPGPGMDMQAAPPSLPSEQSF